MKKKLMFTAIAAFLFLAVVMTTVQIGLSVTWSNDERLTFDPSDDWDPAIIQTSDGKIWVTWHSGRTGNYDIFYKVWSGSSWSNDLQLTSDINLDLRPSILQSSDGKIWIVWASNRTGDLEIFYKFSSDNGASWSSDTRLTTDPSRDDYPSVMQTSDGKVWVFWTSGRNLNPETGFPTADIFYKFSSDAGQTWSDDAYVPTDYKNNYREDLFPSVMQAANGSIWVVWTKEKEGQSGDLYYKTYNGTAWYWEVRLTTDPNEDNHPSIMQTANGRIWVFWDSNRAPNRKGDVYYKVFDGSWSNDTQLTTAWEDDQWPSAMQTTDLTIWVVWTSPRYQQLYPDIFYMTGMELHDLAVRRITPNASHETYAFRGEMVYTEVEVENQGEGKETFEVKSYANSSLLGSKTISLDAGKSYVFVFQWNTTRIRAGNYALKATVAPVMGEVDTADNTLTYTFEIRIKGDICGWYGGVLKPIPNQRVDMDDFGMVVGHWGTVSSTWHPVWGPAADINDDGLVDLDDIMEVAIHFLET